MSIDFRPGKTISMELLLDGRLEEFGIYQFKTERDNHGGQLLTEGENFLWVYGDQEVSNFVCYSDSPNTKKIINAIEECFETRIYTEYEPQYWGFPSDDHLIAAQHESSEFAQAVHCKNLLRFINTTTRIFEPGSAQEQQALIAKELVSKNPELASPDTVSRLLELVEIEILQREKYDVPF